MQKILIALMISVLINTSLSADNDKTGAYVGLGYGSTTYTDDDIIHDELRLSDLDETDVGYKLYTGYKFNDILAVEVSYIDYGEFTASQGYKQSSKSISAGANIGYSFFDNQLRPFGLLGLGYVDSSFENIPSGTNVLEDEIVALHVGFGLEYTPKDFECISLRLATESDIYGLDGKNSSGDDKEYAQGLSIFYMSVHYNF